MTKMSNFEKERIELEYRKYLEKLRREKNSEYYYALGKLAFAALVLGVIVSISQATDSVGIKQIIAFFIGIVLTVLFYIIANNHLKK